MAEVLRLVERDAGGRPYGIYDFMSSTTVRRTRDTLKVTPGAAKPQVSTSNTRYQGGRTIGESHENGTISATFNVGGASQSQAIANIEAFLGSVENHARRGRLMEWRPESTSRSVYFEIRGPGTWTPTYSWVRFSQISSVEIEVSWPIAPIAEWDRMDIVDAFAVPPDAVALYTNLVRMPRADSGTATPIAPDAITSPGTTNVVATTGYGARVFRTTAVATGAFEILYRIGDGAIVPGRTYTGRVKVAGLSGGRLGRLTVDWRTSANGALGFGGQTGFTASGELVVTSVAPATASFAYLRVGTDGGAIGDTLDTDGYFLADSTGLPVPGYFDGETDKAAWTGQPYRSRAVLYDRSTLSDWTFDAGAGTLAAASGRLAVNATGEKRLRYTGRGYDYDDVEVGFRVRMGAVATVFDSNAVLCRLDDNNYLNARWKGDGTGLEIYKRDGGTNTALISTSGLFTALVANTSYWLRFRQEGNVLTVEHYTSPPGPMTTPAGSVTWTLTGNDAIKFGKGVTGGVGLRLVPPAIDYTYGEFTVRPFTRRNVQLPEAMPLDGIPGSAPALMDVEITPSGGGFGYPVFAQIAWAKRARPYSYIWNGYFDADAVALGWSNAGSGLVTGASIARQVPGSITVPGQVGQIQITTHAAVGSGASFRIYRRFKKGVTYTFDAYNFIQSGTWELGFGQGGTADLALSPTSGAAGWTRWQVQWTPTADRDWADVWFRQTTASAGFIAFLTSVSAYEGTAPPTDAAVLAGRGGHPPFGIIEAESATSLSSWALTADTTARGGTLIRVTNPVSTQAARFLLDVSALDPDAFSDEMMVEVWARVFVGSAIVAPTLTLTLENSPTPSAGGGIVRQTLEYPNGKLITGAASGNWFRYVKLGTLPIPVADLADAWSLWVRGSVGPGSVGSWGIDYLLLTPAASTARSPTAKPFNSAYPEFTPSIEEIVRTIRSDLSGRTRYPRDMSRDIADTGLGGASAMQLPPGDNQVLVKLSTLVPDDTTPMPNEETKDHAATVHVAVTPRSFFGRG